MKSGSLPPANFHGPVEFASGFRPQPGLCVVVFDLDGTLSLLRSGWAEVMVDLYAEALPPLPGESSEARRRLALEDILSLNGRQTLHQMIRLTERIRERGGRPLEPAAYKAEYLRRLEDRIGPRKRAIGMGQADPDRWLVPGARAFLEFLRARGLTLYLASGTDQAQVEEEVRLLQMDGYFQLPLYGAGDAGFTKAAALEDILGRTGCSGGQLLSFGDGPVEIQNTKALGGMAVGLAGEETAPGSGRWDPWKRRQLREAGADALIPDYGDAAELFRCLVGERVPPRPEAGPGTC